MDSYGGTRVVARDVDRRVRIFDSSDAIVMFAASAAYSGTCVNTLPVGS